MAPRNFRYQIDDGPWVYETQELPFTIEGVTNANAVKVQPIGAVVSVGPIATITAVITPVMPRVYEGQTLSQIDNWTSFSTPVGFESSIGEIVEVELTYTGDAEDAVTPFALGESIGFTSRPVNEYGQGESFPTVQRIVEYKVNVALDPVTYELQVDINDIVPDGESFGFTLTSGTDYDATYEDVPVGAVRNGPYHYGAVNDAALPEVTGGTALDDTLTITDNGMLSTPTGDLTIGYVWQVNDGGWADIPDEDTNELTIASAIQGFDVRPGIILDDGENAAVTFYGEAITIPAAVVTDPPSATLLTSSVRNEQYVTYSPHTFSIDLDAIGAEDGDEIVFFVGFALRFGTGGAPYVVDFLINGAAQTPIFHGDNGNRFRIVEAYLVDASAGGTMNVSFWGAVDGENLSGFTIYPILLKDHNNVTVVGQGTKYSTSPIIDPPHVYGTVNVTENDILLGLGRSVGSAETPASLADLNMSGVDPVEVRSTTTDGSQRSWLFRKDIPADEAGRVISLDGFNAPQTNIYLNTVFLKVS